MKYDESSARQRWTATLQRLSTAAIGTLALACAVDGGDRGSSQKTGEAEAHGDPACLAQVDACHENCEGIPENVAAGCHAGCDALEASCEALADVDIPEVDVPDIDIPDVDPPEIPDIPGIGGGPATVSAALTSVNGKPAGGRVELCDTCAAVDLVGVPDGAHGWHIHEGGGCGNGGNDAGPHLFYPGTTNEEPAYAPVTATGGRASAVQNLDLTRFGGVANLRGRTIIVHNDGADPKARILCGVLR